MATIKGERQELKPGLFVISRDTSFGKALAFFNETADTQFIISYAFEGAEVKPLGQTQPAKGEPSKFAVTVYPQETQEFVEGKWKSFKRSFSFGPPDKSWLLKQAQRQDQQTLTEIEAVRQLVKKYPRQDGKYTSDYIAQLCVDHKVPFVDLTFPPRMQSLGREWEPSVGIDKDSISWHRPSAWCTSAAPPKLFVGLIEPNDIDQGILGDCYLMSSFACLAEFPHLIRDSFSLQQNPEVGVYRVIVCKNGWWQTVVVDDYLPTQSGKPCFARNREEPNELWVSLLEKAYAKLHGSYTAIKSGDAPHALADILGAPYVKLAALPEWQDKEKMFYLLKAADERDDLMTLSTPSKSNIPAPNLASVAKTYEDLGLAIDHAYSLLQVKEAQGNKLCMIRNPWGNEKEWNGAWSDDSQLWTPSMKAALGFAKADDGTFWMSWADVVKYFNSGSLSYPLRQWPQLRVAANFDEGTPDLMISITVRETVEIFAGCHQRDPRGLPTGDRDLQYCGLLLAILSQPKPGSNTTSCELVAQTNGGTYSTMRDAFVRVTLPANPVPYIIMTQCFEAVSKSFSMSLLVSSPQAIERIVFLSLTSAPPKGQRRHYIPPSKLVLADWSRRAVANFQVRVAKSEGDGMTLDSSTADEVPLRMLVGGAVRGQLGSPSSPASKMVPTGGTSVPPQGAAVRHADPAASAEGKSGGDSRLATIPVAVQHPTTSAASSPTSRLVATGNIKLQLLVLSGRNLVPKDSNGLSDPYVTVKLKTNSGERLALDQRQATRFLPETLNPVWCESFQFNAAAVDVLCIKVWDKDTLGHDAMGELSLTVSDIVKDMTAGGPAKLNWFALKPPPSDARGELQLGFSWML